MSRLTIDITDQQHQSLKALAALQGKTIKQYALERLFPGDADADQAWQELKKHHYVFCLPHGSAPALVVAIFHERMDLMVRLSERLNIES